MAERKPKRTKAHCNNCDGDRWHRIRATEVRHENNDENGWAWTNTFEFLVCGGCEGVQMRRTFWWSEEPEDEEVTYYPPALVRREPTWLEEVPTDIRMVAREVYVALHSGSNRLAAMGTRAMLDMIIVDKVGDAGTFVEKVAAFQKAGYVAPKQVAYLDAALDFGSAVAHRGHWAELKYVTSALDIVEGIAQSVYVLEEAAESLRKNTPARKRRAAP